jgi:hypothetical protein
LANLVITDQVACSASFSPNISISFQAPRNFPSTPAVRTGLFSKGN